MRQENQTRECLLKHYKQYPKMQIEDALKFLFQSAFGCEHLIQDASAAADYIQKEAALVQEKKKDELIDTLDGAYCRVDLAYLDQGLSADTFARLFSLSAEAAEQGKELLEEKLAVLIQLTKEKLLPFSVSDVLEGVDHWRQQGFPACHHSEAFRMAYAPAYRVIKKDYVKFLPLFAKIDRMMQNGRAILAIEGGSASGKTTLSQLLQAVYGCTVFHMDDFFLQPQQRTKERFAQPGGNVDRERFLAEVLLPLSKGEKVQYRRFDCSTFSMMPPVTIVPEKLSVVEGAYSMHPELAGYYDFSVFLNIDPVFQKKRILNRNTPELAERFFREWIPLERHYFEALQVRKRCEMIFDIKEE